MISKVFLSLPLYVRNLHVTVKEEPTNQLMILVVEIKCTCFAFLDLFGSLDHVVLFLHLNKLNTDYLTSYL